MHGFTYDDSDLFAAVVPGVEEGLEEFFLFQMEIRLNGTFMFEIYVELILEDGLDSLISLFLDRVCELMYFIGDHGRL